MPDDLLLVAVVLAASVVCAWYMLQAITGVVTSVPADEARAATQCLALAMCQ